MGQVCTLDITALQWRLKCPFPVQAIDLQDRSMWKQWSKMLYFVASLTAHNIFYCLFTTGYSPHILLPFIRLTVASASTKLNHADRDADCC